MYKAEIRVELKPGILDAEGNTVKNSLNLLGFKEVKEARSIKLYQLFLDVTSKDKAMTSVENACKRLLANPVINDYSIEINEE